MFGSFPIPYPKREFISDDDGEDTNQKQQQQAGAPAVAPIGTGGPNVDKNSIPNQQPSGGGTGAGVASGRPTVNMQAPNVRPHPHHPHIPLHPQQQRQAGVNPISSMIPPHQQSQVVQQQQQRTGQPQPPPSQHMSATQGHPHVRQMSSHQQVGILIY